MKLIDRARYYVAKNFGKEVALNNKEKLDKLVETLYDMGIKDYSHDDEVEQAVLLLW